jgi:hypothetical protein
MPLEIILHSIVIDLAHYILVINRIKEGFCFVVVVHLVTTTEVFACKTASAIILGGD